MIYGRMSAFGVKADSRFEAAMPANDPKPTSRLCPALNQISRMRAPSVPERKSHSGFMYI